MDNKWLEIREASEVLDVELEYLCDQVINGTVKTSTCDDLLMIDVLSLPDFSEVSYDRNAMSVETVRKELEKFKVEYAWLKSENLMNAKLIEDYHVRFSELKRIQSELIEVINHQSETIRALRGYNSIARCDQETQLEAMPQAKRVNTGFSLWMFLPILGLSMAAMVEIFKVQHIYSFDDFLRYIGML